MGSHAYHNARPAAVNSVASLLALVVLVLSPTEGQTLACGVTRRLGRTSRTAGLPPPRTTSAGAIGAAGTFSQASLHRIRRRQPSILPPTMRIPTINRGLHSWAKTEEADDDDEEFEKEARQEAMRRIKQAGKSSSPEEALSVLTDMANIGVMPDAQVITALIDVFSRKGNMAMAMKVFQQMFREDSGLSPDEITFKILVDGYGRVDPPDWAKISRLLNLMELTYGVRPSTMTYNGLLAICSRTKDYERAYELIDRMDAGGIEPDQQTLQIVHEKKALRGYMRKVFTGSRLNYDPTL